MKTRIIIVSNYTYGMGLPHYYFLAFCDLLGKENCVFVPERSQNYSTSLFDRLKRKYKKYTGETSKVKYSEICAGITPGFNNLVLLFNTSNIRREELQELRKRKDIQLLHYISDHPLGMLPERRQQVMETAGIFDVQYVFGHEMVPMLYQWGAKKVVRLPFAYCRYTHLAASENIQCEFPHKVFYFGTHTPDIENWLKPISNLDLVIEGTHWQFAKDEKIRAIGNKKTPQMDANMASMAARAGVVVNFTRAQHACLHSMKTFELAIAGACIVTNRSREQEEFFNDRAFAYFNTQTEMTEIIKKLSGQPELQTEYRLEARKQAMPHDYHARGKTLLETLGVTIR